MTSIAKHEVEIPSIDNWQIYSQEVADLSMEIMENHSCLLAANFSNPQQYYTNFFSMKDYSIGDDRQFYPIFESDCDRFIERLRFDCRRWIEDFNRQEIIKLSPKEA